MLLLSYSFLLVFHFVPTCSHTRAGQPVIGDLTHTYMFHGTYSASYFFSSDLFHHLGSSVMVLHHLPFQSHHHQVHPTTLSLVFFRVFQSSLSAYKQFPLVVFYSNHFNRLSVTLPDVSACTRYYPVFLSHCPIAAMSPSAPVIILSFCHIARCLRLHPLLSCLSVTLPDVSACTRYYPVFLSHCPMSPSAPVIILSFCHIARCLRLHPLLSCLSVPLPDVSVCTRYYPVFLCHPTHQSFPSNLSFLV